MTKVKDSLLKLKNLSVDDILVGLVYLFVALLPLTYWPVIEVGFTVKFSEVVGVAAFALLILSRFWRWVRNPEGLKLPTLRVGAMDVLLLGFWVVTGLSLTQAINIERGVAWWLWLSFYIFGVYYLVTSVIRDEKHLRGLLKTYILVAAGVAVFGIYQFFADYLDLSFTLLQAGFGKFGGLGYPRPHAFLKEPLLFGHYLLAPALFLAVSFLSRKAAFFRPWVEGLLTFLFVLVIWATLSRGAVGALLGALVVLALSYSAFRVIKGKRFAQVFSPVGKRFLPFLLILALAVPAYTGMTKLGLYFEDTSGVSVERATRLEKKRETALLEQNRLSLGDPRYVNWRSAWKMFKEKPLLGVGWGNFGPALTGVTEGITGHGKVFPIVNNEPLEVAVESGILGLIFYLGFSTVFAWQMLRGLWRSVAQKLYAWTPIFAGFLLSFLALTAQFLTFSTIQIGHFWLILGLGISGWRMASLEKK